MSARAPLSIRIVGPRLELRPPRAGDLAALRAATRDNLEHLRPWSPAPAPGVDPLSITGLAGTISRARRDWVADRQYVLLAFARPAVDVIVGRIALTVTRGAFQNAYVGYWVDGRAQGHGFAAEMLSLTADLAFGPLGLHRLQAAVMPRNTRSLRVVDKVGFRREGLAERYLQIAGAWEDHALFALTREEWQAARGS